MGLESGGLRRLARYVERVTSGTQIYGQGEIPERVIVVLRGRIVFDETGSDGTVTTAGEATAGQLVGHIAAVNVQPTTSAARAAEDTILLSIPIGELAEAIQDAPSLASVLTESLVTASPGRARKSAAPTDQAETITLPHLADDEFFFVDHEECPVCGTAFEYLKIRTRGVRPGERQSDLYVSYTGHDPTWYALVVCPVCSYSAYHDDFDALDATERSALAAATEHRRALGARPLTGQRTVEDADLALELGIESYSLRHPNARRHAVLLHRRAWLARANGDHQTEMHWLEQARDAYQIAYERDPDVSEEGALRAAYLIGDLTLRLGDPHAASRWLEICTKSAGKDQSGLVRMARERLFDAREAAKALSDASPAAS